MEYFQQLVEGFEDSVLILLDLDGTIQSWNAGAQRITGYGASEAIGRNVSILYSTEAQAAGQPARDLDAVLREEQTIQDGWRVRRDGTLFPARVRRTLLKNEQGVPGGISSLIHDLTEIKLVEKESEERLRMLGEGVEDCAIFMLDPGGHIRSWNAGAARITQYAAREIMGRHFSIFYLSSEVEAGAPERQLETARRANKAVQEGWRVRKDGSRFWAHVITTALRDKTGGLVGFSRVARDLTQRKADEEAIKRSEALFAGIVRISEDAIISVNSEQRVTLFNEGAEKIFGYPAAAILGQPLELLIPARFVSAHRRHLASFRDSSDVLRAMNERGAISGLRRDGTEFPAEASISRFDVGGETVLTVRLRDITERRLSEEAVRRSEARFASIVQISEDAIISLDEKQNITLFNKGAETIFGYSSEQAIGKNIEMLLPGRFAAVLAKETGALSGGGDGRSATVSGTVRTMNEHGAIFGLRSDGTEFPAEASISHFDVAGEHVLAIRLRDMTERKQNEERIRKSLEEKEVLLKEIHHRVKNNLQVVSSLLSLEAGSPRVAAAKELFLESQNRVASMALIHEKLYQSNDFSNIDFADYLKSLAHILLDSYSMNPERITLTIDVDGKLDIHRAVPCGLIVNELLSNSLKHAFPNGRSGNIVLRLHEADGRRLLRFADDGIGMPASIDFRKTESLGLQLVTSLTSQIGGVIRRLPGHGTAFEIDFPVSQSKTVKRAAAMEV